MKILAYNKDIGRFTGGADMVTQMEIDLLSKYFNVTVSDNFYEIIDTASYYDAVFISSAHLTVWNDLEVICEHNPNTPILVRCHELCLSWTWFSKDHMNLSLRDIRESFNIIDIADRHKNIKFLFSTGAMADINKGIIKNSFLIRMPINKKNISDEWDTHRVNPKNIKTITYISGMMSNPQKGLNVVIEAIKSTELGKYRWIFVGDDKEYPEELIKLADERRGDVILWGYANDLNKIYEMSDVVLILSTYESLSLTALEAISHGCYVITSSCNEFTWTRTNMISLGYDRYTAARNLLDKLNNLTPYSGYDISRIKGFVNSDISRYYGHQIELAINYDFSNKDVNESFESKYIKQLIYSMAYGDGFPSEINKYITNVKKSKYET